MIFKDVTNKTSLMLPPVLITFPDLLTGQNPLALGLEGVDSLGLLGVGIPDSVPLIQNHPQPLHFLKSLVIL